MFRPEQQESQRVSWGFTTTPITALINNKYKNRITFYPIVLCSIRNVAERSTTGLFEISPVPGGTLRFC